MIVYSPLRLIVLHFLDTDIFPEMLAIDKIIEQL
jgi:hypothetical protein